VVNRSIDIDELWRVAARRFRGPQDAPRDVHVEGLRHLAAAVARDGRYDDDALRLLQRELFMRIVADLKLSADVGRHPDIAAVPVARPLLIAGFGRTGSTLLQHLLALDPNARTPLLWELWHLSPPPRPETRLTDPRIELAQRRLEAFTRADPSILQIHPMAARAPDECHWIMRHSPLLPMLYEAPEYWTWLKQLNAGELEQLYAHYRLQAQYLQLFCPGRHWVSKATAHLHFLPALFRVFPDARMVRLHRDPCEAIPSLCSLVTCFRRLFSSRVNHGEIGATILDMFVDNMRRSMAAPEDRSDRIIDIQFADFVADPIAAVRRIYAQFGYPYGADFEEEMVRYLREQRIAARPRHSYALGQFGLSRAMVIERSAEYLEWVRPRCGELIDTAIAM
jgi:Sulfotransferase family